MGNLKDLSGISSLPRRYLAAFLVPVVKARVRRDSWPVFPDKPLSAYSLTVVFAGWYGEARPGLLSVVISSLLSDFFLIKLPVCLWLPEQVGQGRLLLLVVIGPYSVFSELQPRIGKTLPATSGKLRSGGMELCTR
jgi:hypothetical protein